ncbi:MAG: hypothetical protein OXB86_02910 [Bdellovibrionales bacterium]|nr:hypothetical protein [Bdellovibrionales bacterium]
MGYAKACLLICCFVLVGCQTVTVSNKKAKFKERHTQAQGAYKRYVGFSRSFASVTPTSSSPKKENLELKIISKPHKVLSQKFYFFGLFPRVKKINLAEVCEGRTVSLMQTKMTWKDFLTGVATLGMVFPKTAKIWC